MPGLILNVGGKLDKSYSAALQQAAVMARAEARRMDMIRTVAPDQLAIVNKALAKLPAESLMRPRLEAMKTTLESAMGTAGATAGSGFLARFLAKLGGHEGKMGMMQLVHTGRATFDALVAGISPWRVFLYEMPQLLQSITLIGGTALQTLKSLAIFGGSVAAIIGAPFLYFWRTSAMAGGLAKFKLPDVSSDYIARVDTVADSYRRIATAIRDTVNQYNNATSAAERAHKAMEAQFALQKELDSIAKERAIQAAHGDKLRIAAIEKQYEQLGIQRETSRLDAEKAAKIRERAALEKEIAEKQKQIAGITVGGDKQHTQTMKQMEAQYEAAKKFIAENVADDPGPIRKYFRLLRAQLLSGGAVAGMTNPMQGARMTQELLNEEAKGKQNDLERAQLVVKQYQELLNLENSRNVAIKEREKLQSEAEKQGERYAQLTQEINDADKEKAQILQRMNTLAGAKAGQIDQNAIFGGGSARDLTANQRIGAYAPGNGMTAVDVGKQTNVKLDAIHTTIKEFKKPGGLPGFDH